MARTLRALAASGVAAEDAGQDLAAALARVDGPVWLVSAGAWPASARPDSRPTAQCHRQTPGRDR